MSSYTLFYLLMASLSQALWRRVQFSGCTTLYITEKTFNTFFRMLVAIPFLPLVEINDALEDLASFNFNSLHPSLSKMEDFRDKILDYFKRLGVLDKFSLPLIGQLLNILWSQCIDCYCQHLILGLG